MLYTIIDIETTGNGLKGNKITEISIFKYDGQKVLEEFTSLVNPQCAIPPFITGLTGIDNETVRQAPIFAEIAEKVMRMTQDCIFVAHAVNFDYGVIKEEFRQLNFDFSRKKLCTVRLSRKLIPGLQSYSLGKLCSSLGITIADRHRAKGDAEATVKLFAQLLQKAEAGKTIQEFLHSRSQEATLPPHLKKSVLDAIPNKPGVYYFLDQKKSIIYVGKAKNLKKRVLGHFYDKSEHEVKLCREIAHIDFELSGGELIALLMESAAIKKHLPKFNRAQKRTPKQYGIFCYEDRAGLLHLAFAPSKQVLKPLVTFANPTQCRTYLQQLANTFGLCPKLCQLVALNSHEYACLGGSCHGVCQGLEPIIDYNRKVKDALASLMTSKSCLALKQNGRNTNESGFVLIEDGQYKGYGFIDDQQSINGYEDLKAFLIPQKNTLEAQRILNKALPKPDLLYSF